MLGDPLNQGRGRSRKDSNHKIIMKTKKLNPRAGIAIILLVGSALVATSGPGPHHGHSQGTDILHFFIRGTMLNDGVLTNASGMVQAEHNEQGHSDHQLLKLHVGGLDTNSAYSLYGQVGDDTNLTWVTDFTSDSGGNASLSYANFGNGKANNGHGHGMGHNTSPLPAALDPVSRIRELEVDDSSTQAVLTADFTMPDVLKYLVKRDLSTNSVDASLRIHATSTFTQFRLIADGLNPQQDYWLVLNGSVEETNTTDAEGRLMITALPADVTNILDVQSLQLWDSSSNAVIQTELP
jgi:hypothetical protein